MDTDGNGGLILNADITPQTNKVRMETRPRGHQTCVPIEVITLLLKSVPLEHFRAKSGAFLASNPLILLEMDDPQAGHNSYLGNDWPTDVVLFTPCVCEMPAANRVACQLFVSKIC